MAETQRPTLAILLFLGLLVAPVFASAGEIDYSTYAHIVGSLETPGLATGLALSGNHLFVADGLNGLAVVDISNPSTPALIGQLDTPGSARGVVVAGSYAYVADGGSMRVIDISNSALPAPAGSVTTPGNCVDVAVNGAHAYLSCETAGIQVADISVPTAPVIVGSAPVSGVAADIAVRGDLLLVTAHAGGLQVFDISSPATPALQGSASTFGNDALDVAARGDSAYVAVAGGLQVFDLSVPTAPTSVGLRSWRAGHCLSLTDTHAVLGWRSGVSMIDLGTSLDVVGSVGTNIPTDVVTAGDFAYVSSFVISGQSRIDVIDIAPPQSPPVVGFVDTFDQASQVVLRGTHAYIADRSGISTVDISDPGLPLYIDFKGSAGNHRNLTLSANSVWSSTTGIPVDPEENNPPYGVSIYDILAPGSLSYRTTLFTNDAVLDLDADSSFVYLSAGTDGLLVYDAGNPTLESTFDTDGTAEAVAVTESHAYLADNTFGLQVIDISNPSAPTLAGSFNTSGTAYGVALAIADTIAYVADGASGLHVFSVADPTNPALLGTHNTPGTSWRVVASGNYAYVGDLDAGLRIIDVSNPSAPVLAGALDTPGSARGVALRDTIVFVADGTPGIQIISVADPTNPTLLASYDTPGYPRGIDVDGNYAYVADNTSGLLVLNISDPSSPVFAGSVPTPSTGFVGAFDVRVADGRAYVADHSTCLVVIDVSDPNNPLFLGQYDDIGGSSRGVALLNNHAYVAETTAGLRVLDIQLPRLVASIPPTDEVSSAAISGHYAYVADGTAGIHVVDISNPVSPNILTTLSTGDATEVYTSGSSLFVSDRDDFNIRVVDIAAPGSPVITDTLIASLHSSAGRMDFSDGTAYITHSEGIQIVNLANSGFPLLVGNVLADNFTSDTAMRASDVVVQGDHIFVTTKNFPSKSRLLVYDRHSFTVVAVPDTPAPPWSMVSSAFPNPLRTRTRIAFDIPQDSPVDIEIFDVTGRLVRDLTHQSLSAGPHAVVWDGVDDHGRPVPAGVYLYRLRAGVLESTKRIVVIR